MFDNMSNKRKFSTMPQFSNKYVYESEIKTVLSKMDRAANLIGTSDPKMDRVLSDISDLKKQLQDSVFYENSTTLTDEEWAQQEKDRELKLKKLMTVAKSKYYMLKINYSKIFEKVDFEAADGSFESSSRLETDLKREEKKDEKSTASINVSETSENLNSEEQIQMREKIIQNDKIHADKLTMFTDEFVQSMEQTKEFDDEY